MLVYQRVSLLHISTIWSISRSVTPGEAGAALDAKRGESPAAPGAPPSWRIGGRLGSPGGPGRPGSNRIG